MAEKPTYEGLEQRVREMEKALLRAQQESKQRGLEVSALAEGSRSVLEHQEFVDAVRHVFDHCKKLVGATAGYIALLNREKTENKVLFLDPGGLSCTVDPGSPMPIRGLRAEAYHTGKAVYDNNFARSHWMQYMPGGHVTLKNVMFSPLVIEGETVGLLGLANKDGDFTDHDARMAAVFGELAAIALRNSLLANEQKRGEEALKRERDKAQMYLDLAGVIMVTINAHGAVTLINKKGCQIIGCKQEEIVGKNWFDNFLPERLRDTVKNVSLRLLAGEIEPVEYYVNPILTKKGEERLIEWHNAVLRDEKGNIIGHLSSGNDITDRVRAEKEKKQLEARLQETQRLESIGTLAGGIAHNFNNLLSVIGGNASLMYYDMEPAHPHCEMLADIKQAVKTGTELTAQLLGYARKGRYYVKPLDLNRAVQRVSRAIGGTRKEVSVHTALADGLLAIEADHGQIDQVLMNLCVNAADAMPAGGDLFLKTANVTEREMKGTAYDAKPGNYVKLTVSDTGKGMDKETLKRIFEPFFTTKEMGRGTGLGLASVYGIVKGHGGYTDVESEEGRGTTFRVYLPATDKKVEETVKVADEPSKGSETILVVDDEEMVLRAARRGLTKMGYTVLEARNAVEAVEVYKENKIDLVVLDMIMPNVGGGVTYDRMKRINPKVKVILTSGYSIDSEAKEILARGCDAFMQKPFDVQELSQKMREVLDKK